MPSVKVAFSFVAIVELIILPANDAHLPIDGSGIGQRCWLQSGPGILFVGGQGGEVGVVIDPDQFAEAEETATLFLQTNQRLVFQVFRRGDNQMIGKNDAAFIRLALASFPRLDIVVFLAGNFNVDDRVFPVEG